MPESEGPSDYHFDIEEYSNDNLGRIESLIRTKGRGHSWDFFDPQDLANEAMLELWKKVGKKRDSFLEKELIDKLLSTIVVRIWIREVRRELEKKNLRGSGNVCVSLFEALDGQVADLVWEFEVALRQLFDHVKAELSPRQKRIVELLSENRTHLEISLELVVSESTINREIASLKKEIVMRLS